MIKPLATRIRLKPVPDGGKPCARNFPGSGTTGRIVRQALSATLIRLEVERLPTGGDPLWVWSSTTGMTGADVDLRWQAFLGRFDLEHTFRMIKQMLGWTRPKLRTTAAADRWTWLILVAHTQLRLARPLAEDVLGPGNHR